MLRAFALSVCGSHARCSELPSGKVTCLPRGANAVAYDADPNKGHYFAKNTVSNALVNANAHMPQRTNTTQILDMYKPFFVGSFAECKNQHFTHEPLSDLKANQNIQKMPRVVEWQRKELVMPNASQIVYQQRQRKNLQNKLIVAGSAANDWENYPNYGGCRECTHLDADPSPNATC